MLPQPLAQNRLFPTIQRLIRMYPLAVISRVGLVAIDVSTAQTPEAFPHRPQHVAGCVLPLREGGRRHPRSHDSADSGEDMYELFSAGAAERRVAFREVCPQVSCPALIQGRSAANASDHVDGHDADEPPSCPLGSGVWVCRVGRCCICCDRFRDHRWLSLVHSCRW